MLLPHLIILFERDVLQVLFFFIMAFCILFVTTKRVNKMSSRYPPGPVGLPLVGSLPFLGAEPHKSMVKLTRKYGNIFSLYLGTKYTVVLNDFESTKEGLSHPAALGRAPNMFNHIIGGFGFSELNGPQWKEQRRFCMNVMKDLGLGRGLWENLINEEISDFTKEMEALQGQPTYISPLLTSSISNNIVSLLIGRRLDKEKEKNIAKLFYEFSKAAFKYVGPSETAVLIPGFRKFMEFFKVGGYGDAQLVMKRISNFLKEEIHQNWSLKETTTNQNFIMQYLDKIEQSNARGERLYAFTEKILEGNLNNLFLGGSDTIITSMTFLFWFLAAYPDVQKKIHRELDSVLGHDVTPSYEDHRKTPYTFATILETERYASIVPLSTTRLVTEDYELGGYIIPKGAQIFGNFWAIHHDPKYWKQPEKFLPERFLTEDGSRLLPKLPKCYLAFSIGKRNCPGEKVALMEIYLYLCSVMQKFSISPPPGEELNFKVTNGLIIQLEPQKLCVRLREI